MSLTVSRMHWLFPLWMAIPIACIRYDVACFSLVLFYPTTDILDEIQGRLFENSSWTLGFLRRPQTFRVIFDVTKLQNFYRESSNKFVRSLFVSLWMMSSVKFVRLQSLLQPSTDTFCCYCCCFVVVPFHLSFEAHRE